MTRVLHRRQRPASLQLLPTHGFPPNQETTFSGQTPKASKIPSPSQGRTPSPRLVTTARASSPLRPTTTISTSRVESPQLTVFITTTTTRHLPEEDETPSPTQTVFFPAPETVLVTISDTTTRTAAPVSTATVGTENSQAQNGSSSSGGNQAPSRAAITVLAVLGAFCK